jgi:hypothetical protein
VGFAGWRVRTILAADGSEMDKKKLTSKFFYQAGKQI